MSSAVQAYRNTEVETLMMNVKTTDTSGTHSNCLFLTVYKNKPKLVRTKRNKIKKLFNIFW